MGKFRYVGDDARVYPDLSLSVEPGAAVDLDEAPADGRWTAAKQRGRKDDAGDDATAVEAPTEAAPDARADDAATDVAGTLDGSGTSAEEA